MGFERSCDLEGLGEDADMAIAAANKDVVGPSADAVKFIALATSVLKAEYIYRKSTDIED